MAKGKYAARAQRRADDSAMAHIDRLTTQLAEEKMRRRDAERRAGQYAGLDNMVRLREAEHDEALKKALEKLAWWDAVRRDDKARREAALDEIQSKLRADLGMNHMTTTVEWIEFLTRRYPRLISALTAGSSDTWHSDRPLRRHTSPHRHYESKLNDEDLVKFQIITGQRGVKQSDGRLIEWADLFEARQMDGMAEDDLIELASRDTPT